MTDLQTREENGTMMESPTRYYVVGGVVVAGLLGYWLWKRSQTESADSGTGDGGTTGGGDTTGGGTTGGGTTGGGVTKPPKTIPATAWSTNITVPSTYPIEVNQPYVVKVLLPTWVAKKVALSGVPTNDGDVFFATMGNNLEVTLHSLLPAPEEGENMAEATLNLIATRPGPGVVQLLQKDGYDYRPSMNGGPTSRRLHVDTSGGMKA